MNHASRLILALILATTWTACGDDASSDDAGAADASGDGDGDSGADGGGEEDAFLAPAGDGWRTLIEGDWELAAGTERYRCARITIPEDTYISALKPVTPAGTHHTLLSIDEVPMHEDGVTDCGAFDNGTRQIGSSGVGSNPYELPEGVAMELRAGWQVTLNLHLFNTGEDTLSGQSGVLVKTIDEDDVTDKAETVLAGSVMLEIPPGRVVQSGTCTFTHDATIFSVFPHMHQTGVYMKVVAHSSSDGEVTLFDGRYSFDEQAIHILELVDMKEGDTVDIECTYQNDGEETIMWGDSSLDEMCFAGLGRFPPGEPTLGCLQ